MLQSSKLSPPRVPDPFLERPRLDRLLDASVSAPLVLVSAQAGSGKTIQVASWLAKRGHRVAWFSADEDDSDLKRFWSYLLGAIKRQVPELPGSVITLAQSGQIANVEILEEITAAIGRALSENDRDLVLVIDDYHRILSAEVDKTLDAFLDQAPSQLRVIILTRAEPALSLSRRRVNRSVNEIRYADLRFDVDESFAFFDKASAGSLEEEECRTLSERTEGWIAGLQLALLSLRHHANRNEIIDTFSGTNWLVADYLADEVLDSLPERTREFLLATSILNELTAPLCSSVVGDMSVAECDAMLLHLERTNMFVSPLDDSRQLYRFHHLFRTTLGRRLSIDRPGQYRTYHHRAARWYAEANVPEMAFWHARHTDDPLETINIIEEFVDDLLWRTTDYHTLGVWLSNIPPDLRDEHPKLWLTEVWMLAMASRHDEIGTRLDRARDAIEALPESESTKWILSAEFYALDCFVKAYRVGRLEDDKKRHIEDCIATLPDVALKEALLLGLAATLSRTGELAAANKAYDELRELSIRTGNTLTTGIASTRQHDIAYVLGDLTTQKHIIGTLERTFDSNDQLHPIASGTIAWSKARTLFDQGEWHAALEAVSTDVRAAMAISQGLAHAIPLLKAQIYDILGDTERAVNAAMSSVELRDSVTTYTDWAIVSKPAVLAQLFLNIGDVKTARFWISKCDRLEIRHNNERSMVVYARVLGAEQRTKEALDLLARVIENASAGSRGRCVAEALIARSIIHQQEGATKAGLASLTAAMKMTAQHGHIALYVAHGAQIAPLLQLAAHVPSLGHYARELLRRIAKHETIPTKSIVRINSQPKSQTHDALAERLTQREVEVLSLLASGYNNQEVAELLSVSPHTIKVHTRNIYGKLDVKNRTQAILRAQHLQILTD